MTDDAESAAAAWLDSPSTEREVQVVLQRFPELSRWEATRFALLIEMLVVLQISGAPDDSSEPIYDSPPIEFMDDDDEPKEPWQS